MSLSRSLALSVLLGTGVALGGGQPVPENLSAPEPEGWSGDWCAPLRGGLGLRTEGWEPWLWDLKMFGRLQYQYEFLEGREFEAERFICDDLAYLSDVANRECYWRLPRF